MPVCCHRGLAVLPCPGGTKGVGVGGKGGGGGRICAVRRYVCPAKCRERFFIQGNKVRAFKYRAPRHSNEYVRSVKFTALRPGSRSEWWGTERPGAGRPKALSIKGERS